VVGLLVAACGTASPTTSNLAPNDKQILRVNINTEPNSLDPGQQQYSYEADIGAQIAETLVKIKPDMSDVAPATADSWTVSADGLTWKFHIRQGAKYNDGVQVKAQDFVYGWKRIFDPSLAAVYESYFTVVKGADKYSDVNSKDPAAVSAFLDGLGLSAPDASTFQVTLATTAPYFKWIAGLWVAAPIRKDVVDKYGSDKWASSPSSLITNGPFKVSEMVSKDHITLVPNPYYWGGAPKLQKIINYEIADDNQAYAKYLNGELDIVNIPLANTDLVKTDPKLSKEIKTVPQLVVFWLDFNTRKAPFDNPKLRLAFAKSVDRNGLSNKLAHGRYLSADYFIPNGMVGYRPDLGAVQKFDPTAAKQLLKDAGVADASKVTIDFLLRNSTTNIQIGQYIQDQLQTNLGVKVNLQLVDSKTVTDRLRKHDYHLYVGGWGADYPDDQDWADVWVTGSGNTFGGWSNTQYDNLVKQADAEMDAKKRQGLYDQAQKILLDEAAGGMLYQRNNWFLVKPYVSGLTTTASDFEVVGDQFWSKTAITAH
jgi:oligopeptide transport system substrate-binding protein